MYYAVRQTDEEARFGYGPSIARYHFVFSLLRLCAAVSRASRAEAAEIFDAGGVEYAAGQLKEAQKTALGEAEEEKRLRDGDGFQVVVTAEGIAAAAASAPPVSTRGGPVAAVAQRLFPPLMEHHLIDPRAGGDAATEPDAAEAEAQQRPQENGPPASALAAAQGPPGFLIENNMLPPPLPSPLPPAAGSAAPTAAPPPPWSLWTHVAAVARALKPRQARLKYALKVAAVRRLPEVSIRLSLLRQLICSTCPPSTTQLPARSSVPRLRSEAVQAAPAADPTSRSLGSVRMATRSCSTRRRSLPPASLGRRAATAACGQRKASPWL